MGADHDHESRRPKKLIFAPGDIQATPDLKISSSETSDPSASGSNPHPSTTHDAVQEQEQETLRSEISTPDSTTEQQLVSHPSRAHQFIRNPPLTISQIHPSNPLHQFHTWFRDPRLTPSLAPETCTLATASLPSGRVSARMVYLKELDERGWVVYSNWGSREGKGGQVFGADDGEGLEHLGNKWGALTFAWSTVERQVRIEGLLERLTREESEMYWRTRERESQLGAWASWQSKVLWSAEPDILLETRRKSLAEKPEVPADMDETDVPDGREVLEQRVNEMRERFKDVEDIPLPPFWGGVRLVPESVEFWQGRKSRLHDRFRYVRVHERDEEEGESLYRWRIQRLSP
ncbi:pyridoxamine-phosphate oxidase PDX3 [Aspergillus glaucus CBS 516.65]|uniref:pyridoxal 5'-phosphate synthase n=1 Tax=Aspergillus glaucus CBS 516.65 TaxID=1160497 RepID=A0A1L9VCW2_ASPGL|nr:hypothetical protein ASPGLDRAFT_131979 [Aspergillus glaucus CBS 516.65]OJJ81725.1 hypothetical protein ASPGLDRAFT_131979 [Aspergillus glaucus CBS 516.65]